MASSLHSKMFTRARSRGWLKEQCATLFISALFLTTLHASSALIFLLPLSLPALSAAFTVFPETAGCWAMINSPFLAKSRINCGCKKISACSQILYRLKSVSAFPRPIPLFIDAIAALTFSGVRLASSVAPTRTQILVSSTDVTDSSVLPSILLHSALLSKAFFAAIRTEAQPVSNFSNECTTAFLCLGRLAKLGHVFPRN